MENVVLVIHLILALALIGVVLLQRSEGAALLSGGGNMTGRAAMTPMAKITWALAIAFIGTSITLTILAAEKSASSSVVDRLGVTAPAPVTPEPAQPAGDTPVPPTAGDSAPVVPRAD